MKRGEKIEYRGYEIKIHTLTFVLFFIVKAKAALCDEIKKFTDTEQWSLKLCLGVCPHLILISQKK